MRRPTSTGRGRDSEPGTGVGFLLRTWFKTICMMPAKERRMIGVSNWQRLVTMARDCSVRLLRNWRTGGDANAQTLQVFFLFFKLAKYNAMTRGKSIKESKN